MKEIIEIAELRNRFKLELEIMAEFFKTKALKMAVLNSKNQLKIFNQQSNDFEKAVNNLKLKDDLYGSLLGVDDTGLKDILTEYLSDFKSELLFFKIEIKDFIYIIYFPFNPDLQNHNQESLELFKKQCEAVLEDIYRQEEIKDNLNQKNLENKNLKKEKYITASALDSVPGNIAILDKEGKIVYTNSAWENFGAENGAPAAGVGLNKNYLDVCKRAAENGDLISAAAYNGILSVLNNEEDTFTLDYPCHSPSTKRWFRMYVSSFKGIGSYELMILHQNITREIMAEKKSEEILNKLPASIMKFDSQERLIYFNEKAMDLFNLNENSLGEKFDIPKVADGSEDDFLDKLQLVRKNKNRIEFRILVEDNSSKKYYKAYLVPEFKNNKLTTITSIIPENQNNRKYKKRESKQINHYLQLFNNFPDALVLLNIDEKIINANKSFCQLFDYQIDEIKNIKLDQLIVPADAKEEARTFSHLVLTGAQLEKEVKRLDSQGKEMDLNLIAFPVLLNNNKIGIYAVYREKK